MNKNTFYAIAFSTLIIIGSFYIQARFFAPPEQATLTEEEIKQQESTLVKVADEVELNQSSQESVKEQEISITSNIFTAQFSNKNAVMTSLSRKRNINGKEETVELIPAIDTNDIKAKKNEAFRVFFADEQSKDIVNDVLFNVERPDSQSVVFSQVFQTKDGQVFTLEKKFVFADNEDVFEFTIDLKNSQNEALSLGEVAYTLVMAPQLGPREEILESANQSKRISRRWFVTFSGKKLKNINNVKSNRPLLRDEQYKWSGIASRYFSLLVLTNSVPYTTRFSMNPIDGFVSGAQLSFLRPALQSSAVSDKFRIYVGPSSGAQLTRYNNADENAFNISDAQFNKIKPRRLLSVLERPLKWLLNLFYKLIPNYGVAIILLTIVVRLVTYPIMRKSKVNGEKMKTLSPKIEAIKKQFPDDQQQQSRAIMEMYRREKFSPFSSVMPMFIQFPFFIAMYRVVYESFELWRQPFFGWVNDLSQPDVLISFGSFTVPFVNWTGLHLLPIIMVGTQFFSSLIIMKQQQQSSPTTGKGMMMFLSYGFPFIIFFALYNSPAGLILYWIVSNLFTVLTMFDKPKISETKKKATKDIISDAKKQSFKTKTQQKKDKTVRKKSFLEKMQDYVDENTKQTNQRKK